MGQDTSRYYKVVTFRLIVSALALLVAARALHEFKGAEASWPLAALLTIGAAAAILWPFVVPSIRGAARTYSPAHGFFLAGMLLLPPAALVAVIAFSITLTGLLNGARGYRTLFGLSAATLVYAGFALYLRLGPAPWDAHMHPASRVGLETVFMASALIAHLIVRSIAMRIELGAETPHWGAFQPPALLEMFLCLVLAVTITLLGRVHLLFLAVVYAQLGLTAWMVHRHRVMGRAAQAIRGADQRPDFKGSAP